MGHGTSFGLCNFYGIPNLTTVRIAQSIFQDEKLLGTTFNFKLKPKA